MSYNDETSLFSVGTPTVYSPIISDSSGNLNSSSYNVRVSRYTKIGRLVYYQGQVSISNKSGLTAGNTIRVSLPFASLNVPDMIETFNIGRMNNMTTNIVSVSATIFQGTDYMSFWIRTAASANATAMLVSDVSPTWDLRFGGFYFADT